MILPLDLRTKIRYSTKQGFLPDLESADNVLIDDRLVDILQVTNPRCIVEFKTFRESSPDEIISDRDTVSQF